MGKSVPKPSADQLTRLMSALDQRDYLRDLVVLCKGFRATLEEVLSGDRHMHISRARAACVARMRDDGLSWTSIADLLGIDQSAAQYAYKKHNGSAPQKKRRKPRAA